MLDSDRPILKSEQDRLGRSIFAKYLARCILDHQSTESMVIGLYGGWGVGKTSVINLTLEELRFAASNMFDNEKPIILNFSPWSYSGQQQLIYSFFRRLSSEMRQSDYFENADKIIYLLELYVSFFTHKPVPKSLHPKHFWLSRLLKPGRTTEESYGWESGRDLTQVKAELNNLLKNQKHKIIIFIDNITRLDHQEINQIFQIVKSIGDFMNTTYILALDKTHIIEAINKIHHGNGNEYLEKIVQLPFAIPAISKQDLENVLFDRLSKVMSAVPEDSWNRDYWADLYYSTIKYFFENCRDITRYVNTLSFGYSRVKEVVNPVDFFAITAIEIFEPDVYYGIRDNKDLFADLAENVYQFDNEKFAEDKLRCDEILNRAKNTPKELLIQLLVRLFPRLRHMYQSNMTFNHSEAAARKAKRICALDVFDIYFRLAIPSGYISDAEMDALLSFTSDAEGFALELMRLNHDDRIGRFLDSLDSTRTAHIPIDNIPNVINALIDSGDLFPIGVSTPLCLNTPMRIHRIIHQLLIRLDDKTKRFEILSNAIKQSTKSLLVIVNEVEENYILMEQRDFTAEQLEQLKQLALEKIAYWVENGRLFEHPQLLSILIAWRKWGDTTACKAYIEKMIASDNRHLLAFLSAALKEPVNQAISKLEMNSSWRENLPVIEEFISANTLEPYAQRLFASDEFEKLREKEQLAILIFLNLVKPNSVKIIPKTTI